MIDLRTPHTADLSDGSAAAIRELLDGAFGKISEDTYQNVLGGVHALLVADGTLIGQASVVQRRMRHGGRALRTGYIEGVAVRADRRRRGRRLAARVGVVTGAGRLAGDGEPVAGPGYRAAVTLGLDILLLNVDGDLRMVREFEYVGYAVRAADLIELAVAGRLILTGRWVKWVTIVDDTPTGEPWLDASLAALAASPKRLMPTDWMARHPGYSPVYAGLAELAGQGAVRVRRQGTGRRTYTEVELLDRARQADVRARLDRYIAAGSAADVLDWALAGLVHQCTLWIPGHFDRAAQRKFKDAAKGERGKSKSNPVEATIRMLMSDAHNCRNVDP